MRIIICGSRDFDDYRRLCDETDELARQGSQTPLVIIHGGARGADALASQAARERYRCSEVIHPAEWQQHGKGAGPIRNRAMAAAGADLCLAFWDGRSPGTKDMIAQAVCQGIPVRIVPWRKP